MPLTAMDTLRYVTTAAAPRHGGVVSPSSDSGFTLRPPASGDAGPVARIIFEGFAAIAIQHRFPPDFPAVEAAAELATYLLSAADIHGVIATRDGGVIGSNFLWEGDPIGGIGPITVDPGQQNAGVGRALMEAVLERVAQQQMPGVRLVQAAYHGRSLALYTSLGFDAREPLSVLQGPVPQRKRDTEHTRRGSTADTQACNALATRLLGHPRGSELDDAIARGQARVVERGGKIVGYSTGIGFFGHAVGETNDDIKTLIATADAIAGPGLLLPTRNAELLRWCLREGLRIVQPMTLMTRGAYRDPAGAYLPSILY
ncbi:MAG: GNAT family N-acetyltransferase [Casimicrobiaceae bacterium]